MSIIPDVRNILFYGKSGFVYASTKGIRYHGLPEEFEAYEATFPVKEKLVLPGQLDQ